MFSLGSNISVLASSESGAGPRRGSLGFLSEMTVIPCHPLGGLYFPRASFVILFAVTVCFYRYGYEKRRRCERRMLTVPFPIYHIDNLDPKEIRDGIHNAARSYMDRVIPYEPNYARRSLILAPNSDKLNMAADPLAAKAYLWSITGADHLMSYLRSNSNAVKRRLGLDLGNLIPFTHTRARDGAQLLYKSWPASGKNTRMLISGLLSATIKAEQNQLIEEIRNIPNSAQSNKAVLSRFIEGYGAAGPAFAEPVKDAIRKKGPGGKSKIKMMEGIEETFRILSKVAFENSQP